MIKFKSLISNTDFKFINENVVENYEKNQKNEKSCNCI